MTHANYDSHKTAAFHSRRGQIVRPLIWHSDLSDNLRIKRAVLFYNTSASMRGYFCAQKRAYPAI